MCSIRTEYAYAFWIPRAESPIPTARRAVSSKSVIVHGVSTLASHALPPPQFACTNEEEFSSASNLVDFDDFPDGLILSDEIAGVLFSNAKVNASELAVSLPNRIISDPLLPQPIPAI